MRRAAPLVGRADELQYVRSSMETSRGVLVAGPAGVGKSRLAAAVVDQLAERGWTVHRCAATPELARIPFAAFASLPGSAGEAALLDRFAAVAAAVDGERAVVLVDDVHDLDEASVAFVHHLLAATEVVLLLTARSGASTAPSLMALGRGPLERLELQPLSRDEVRVVVQDAVGDADPSVAQQLWRRTDGNPLFVHELLHDAMDSGDLVEEDGRWRLVQLRAGDRVQEIVAARLATLDTTERRAVELLALAEPTELGTLEQLVGLDAIEALERRELVVWSTDGDRQEVRLAHPVYGDAIRAELGPAALRRHRTALIGALEAAPERRRDDRLRLATWRAEAGEVVDVGALIGAAADLVHSLDRRLAAQLSGQAVDAEIPHNFLTGAERLARLAYEHGGGYPAAHLLVQALTHLGRQDEVARFLAGITEDTSTPERIVETTVLAAACLAALGEPARAAALYAERAPLVPLGLRERLLVGRVHAHSLALQMPEAAVALRDLDGLVPPAARDRLVLAACRALVLSHEGRCEDALATLDAAIAAADGTEDTAAFVELFVARILSLVRAGQAKEAHELGVAAESMVVAVAGEEAALQVHVDVLLATLLANRGRVEEAHRRCVQAAAGVRRFGDPVSLRHSALLIASQAAALRGRLDEADALLAEVAAATDRDDLRAATPVDRTAAVVAACRGRLTTAIDGLRVVADRFRADGSVVDEITTLHEIVRFGGAASVVDRMRELAAAYQGPFGALVRDHAEGIVAGDGKALDDVAARAADLGLELIAAEVSAHAARCHEEAGLRSSAAASRRRAAELQALCGALTPALRANVAPELTRREREVAERVATGLTDQQVADELVVNVRTVEKHLANAYAKLGVTSRHELTALLRPPPS